MARPVVSMSITGYSELERLLRGIQKKSTVNRLFRGATNAATTLVVQDLRQRVKAEAVESKLLSKSLARKAKTYKTSGVTIGLVGVNAARAGQYKGKNRVPYKYWHFVNAGTAAHVTQPDQKQTKFVKRGSGSPVKLRNPGAKRMDLLAKAVKATAPKVGDVFRIKLRDSLEMELARLRK